MKYLPYRVLSTLLLASGISLLSSCGDAGGRIDYGDAVKLGPAPSYTERLAQYKAEPKGNFYYGRRYFVDKTRFWGYIRKPGQAWDSSRLAIINENYKRQPDRLPESNASSNSYAYDQNYEYQLFGNYTGRNIYDPNSNLFLPEFQLKGYKVVNTNPGWIFSPRDVYNPKLITLRAY